jgi:uncharacterized protein YjlB
LVLLIKIPSIGRFQSWNHPGREAFHRRAVEVGNMPLIENIKDGIEKIANWSRPSNKDIDAALRPRKPNVFRFADDGVVPNSRFPLILYRGPLQLANARDPAALFEVLFARNGWKGSWRNGIYDHVHYHSRTHEVLGIAQGEASVRFGGDRGRILKLKAGDVAILPAGTGHQRIDRGPGLVVVGAYTAPDKYDECRASPGEHERAVKAIGTVRVPKKDLVYGEHGPLVHVWLKAREPHQRIGSLARATRPEEAR